MQVPRSTDTTYFYYPHEKDPMRPVKTTEDIRALRPGQTVCLKSFPNKHFALTDTDELRGEGKKVTIVTVDNQGRPHSLTVSAFSLMYEDEK